MRLVKNGRITTAEIMLLILDTLFTYKFYVTETCWDDTAGLFYAAKATKGSKRSLPPTFRAAF
jgi:hypothetical protein